MKAHQAPFLPKFSPNYPKFHLTSPKKNWRKWPPKINKNKKGCHLILGAIVNAHQAILRRFSHILPKFPQIFPDFKGFFPEFHQIKTFGMYLHPGAEPDIFIWGAIGGASFATRELSMVCVGLQCSGMTSRGKFWGATGGDRQNFGGQWPPWHPPSSASACTPPSYTTDVHIVQFSEAQWCSEDSNHRDQDLVQSGILRLWQKVCDRHTPNLRDRN